MLFLIAAGKKGRRRTSHLCLTGEEKGEKKIDLYGACLCAASPLGYGRKRGKGGFGF